MIDTGCAYASSGGMSQYKAYRRYVGQEEDIGISDSAKCKFDICPTTSLGTPRIKFPTVKIILTVTMHVVETDDPNVVVIDLRGPSST